MPSAAYIARERIKDRESDKIYDYRKRHSEVLFSKIFTPEIVPEWTHDRGGIWNKVQETEFKKRCSICRSLEVSLPHEFSHEHMVELIEDFVRDNFTSKGMIADTNPMIMSPVITIIMLIFCSRYERSMLSVLAIKFVNGIT